MYNPYQAPVAKLDAAVEQDSNAESVVGGFWLRAAAKIIDFLIMLPIVGLTFWLSSQFRMFYLWAVLPSLMLSLFYSVYLVRRYGGTPGKLILKLRIQMKDGAPVSLPAALIREAPLLLMGAATNLGLGLAALSMDDSSYHAVGFMQRSQVLMAAGPAWLLVNTWLMNGWTWVGAIVLLLNKRRRAVHDFLAGTAVVNIRSVSS